MRLLSLLLLASACYGAANMQTASFTVNPSGQPVITFSPCSPPLAYSSGSVVTGVTLTNSVDSGAASVQASTLAGCTLTLTTYAASSLHFPIAADDTASSLSNITFTIAASSNLEDVSGNTISATGNSNISPSVNSSAVYAAGGTLVQSFWQMPRDVREKVAASSCRTLEVIG
jgi:hypothetical protein